MDELEALRRCQRGDRSAFRALVDRYGDLAFRTAYLYVRDRDLAADMCQEAFLAAWKGLGRFNLSQPFKPWLLRIVVNCCLSHHRKTRPGIVPLDEQAAENVVDRSPRPEEVALRRDAQRRVRETLSALDDDHRLVLVLRYFADLSIPEIAAALSCPEGTVKSRLHRALAKARTRLEERERDVYAWLVSEPATEERSAKGY